MRPNQPGMSCGALRADGNFAPVGYAGGGADSPLKGRQYSQQLGVASSSAVVAQIAEAADAATEARRSLAYLATLSLLCLYATPVVCALHLGLDADSAFWMGRFGLAAAIVPVYIVAVHVGHLAHLARGGRSRSAFAWAAIVPAVLLCMIGAAYVVLARQLDLAHFEDREECAQPDAPPHMLELQAAYDQARAALSDCARRSPHSGLQPPTLQLCQEWNGKPPPTVNVSEEVWEVLNNPNGTAAMGDAEAWTIFPQRKQTKLRKDWGRELKYLATAEASHACSGFCESGPMLWHAADSVVGFAGQPCAPYIGLKLRNTWGSGAAVVLASIVSCVVFLALLLAAGPLLGRAGYKD